MQNFLLFLENLKYFCSIFNIVKVFLQFVLDFLQQFFIISAIFLLLLQFCFSIFAVFVVFLLYFKYSCNMFFIIFVVYFSFQKIFSAMSSIHIVFDTVTFGTLPKITKHSLEQYRKSPIKNAKKAKKKRETIMLQQSQCSY